MGRRIPTAHVYPSVFIGSLFSSGRGRNSDRAHLRAVRDLPRALRALDSSGPESVLAGLRRSNEKDNQYPNEEFYQIGKEICTTI